MGACLSQTEKFAAHEIKDVILPVLRDELLPVLVADIKKELNLSSCSCNKANSESS